MTSFSFLPNACFRRPLLASVPGICSWYSLLIFVSMFAPDICFGIHSGYLFRYSLRYIHVFCICISIQYRFSYIKLLYFGIYKKVNHQYRAATITLRYKKQEISYIPKHIFHQHQNRICMTYFLTYTVTQTTYSIVTAIFPKFRQHIP